jgi:hypothetical protein
MYKSLSIKDVNKSRQRGTLRSDEQRDTTLT